MKAGKYYVGDPCYVFGDSWLGVLDKTDNFDGGQYELWGKQVFGGGTAFGDGEYQDNFGNSYAVDAGIIAILPVSLLRMDRKVTQRDVKESGYMHIHEFKEDFECCVDAGKFRFGDIVINTDDSDEELEW